MHCINRYSNTRLICRTQEAKKLLFLEQQESSYDTEWGLDCEKDAYHIPWMYSDIIDSKDSRHSFSDWTCLLWSCSSKSIFLEINEIRSFWSFWVHSVLRYQIDWNNNTLLFFLIILSIFFCFFLICFSRVVNSFAISSIGLASLISRSFNMHDK